MADPTTATDAPPAAPSVPDQTPWAEHSACDQRITDDGQRIAELEADVTRLREALRIAHMHALQGGYGGAEDEGDRHLVRSALRAAEGEPHG